MENESATSMSAPQPSAKPFLKKCYDLVDDPMTDEIVSWGDENDSFVIWDEYAFERDILPRYFKHSKLGSFVRQLNTYGFLRVHNTKGVEYAHDAFRRGQKNLLEKIARKISGKDATDPQHQNQARGTSSNAELQNSVLLQEIAQLKKIQNLLIHNLQTVIQNQIKTDKELCNMTKKVQEMEENQKETVSMLEMFLQHLNIMSQPGQQNGAISEPSKRLRLSRPGEGRDCLLTELQPSFTNSTKPMPVPTNLQWANQVNILQANGDMNPNTFIQPGLQNGTEEPISELIDCLGFSCQQQGLSGGSNTSCGHVINQNVMPMRNSDLCMNVGASSSEAISSLPAKGPTDISSTLEKLIEDNDEVDPGFMIHDSLKEFDISAQGFQRGTF
ncbi:uncharacterized protein A4U43_C03F16280 [Asparagus officinalis]|uniref:HSF-type DNA-binding domain-containing protein n=1 Tax=Asparagus officinalis TaxID=4686 RepID=A0A5P1FCA6_ASPOF|nr:uncharacterized protein A4U43_C03F16280 [Asparagus officinalis]